MIPAKWGNERAEQGTQELHLGSSAGLLLSTAVGVDDPGLHEPNPEVVQDCGFVQVAEGGQVVLPDQDVRVAEGGQLRVAGVHGVVAHLYKEWGVGSGASHSHFYGLHFTYGTTLKKQLQSTVSQMKVFQDLGRFPHMLRIQDPDSVGLGTQSLRQEIEVVKEKKKSV